MALKEISIGRVAGPVAGASGAGGPPGGGALARGKDGRHLDPQLSTRLTNTRVRVEMIGDDIPSGDSMDHPPGKEKGTSEFASPDPRQTARAPTGGTLGRTALFKEVPAESGQVSFRCMAHGKALLPVLLALAMATVGLLATVKAAQHGQMRLPAAYVLGGGLGLFGAAMLGFMVRELWTYQRMLIDPASKSLRILTRTPFGVRREDYSMDQMVSVLVCPPPDGAEHHRVSVEMKDGTYLDLGRGPRADAVTVGRRIAFLVNRPSRLS